MDILFLLIPLSIMLVFLIIWGLWWAVHQGQFEQLEEQGTSILKDSEH
ncbi:MAG: cbb3-type cytochrome oxidase assembly protein CcoS [Formosimonas sp.]